MKPSKPLFALFCLLLIASQSSAQQTTAFTYQGQLRDGGTNANGSYSMTFKLYDAVNGGIQIGSDITTSPTLANGLFSVNLDFGAGAFNGGGRWLDITVGEDTLTPRVRVLPAPYALYAAVAATDDDPVWGVLLCAVCRRNDCSEQSAAGRSLPRSASAGGLTRKIIERSEKTRRVQTRELHPSRDN